MPSVIDAVSLLQSILKFANEARSIVKKTRTINENKAKEILEYITELIELINELFDYKVIHDFMLKLWKNNLEEYRNNLLAYASENMGITITTIQDEDELIPYPTLREDLLFLLNELIEHISNTINFINKQVESGKVDIYTSSEKLSFEFEKVIQFVNFYNDAKAWLNEYANELYRYTTLTLEDFIHNTNELKQLQYLISTLKTYVLNISTFANKFKMYDLMDDVNLVKNMLETIAEGPRIVQYVIKMDESEIDEFDKYNEAFIDSMRYIDDFISNFESLLDSMYQKVKSKT